MSVCNVAHKGTMTSWKPCQHIGFGRWVCTILHQTISSHSLYELTHINTLAAIFLLCYQCCLLCLQRSPRKHLENVTVLFFKGCMPKWFQTNSVKSLSAKSTTAKESWQFYFLCCSIKRSMNEDLVNDCTFHMDVHTSFISLYIYYRVGQKNCTLYSCPYLC